MGEGSWGPAPSDNTSAIAPATTPALSKLRNEMGEKKINLPTSRKPAATRGMVAATPGLAELEKEVEKSKTKTSTGVRTGSMTKSEAKSEAKSEEEVFVEEAERKTPKTPSKSPKPKLPGESPKRVDLPTKKLYPGANALAKKFNEDNKEAGIKPEKEYEDDYNKLSKKEQEKFIRYINLKYPGQMYFSKA
jgi:hypothetical protein